MAKKFLCSQCGQTFEAASMPDKCPICGADASHIKEVKSKGINTNGNVYTICYAAVMVIIVAFLLAFVSSALKPAQDANVAIDKKNQILMSLGVRGLEKSQVEAKFDELIKSSVVLDADGNAIEGANAFDVETKEIGEKFPIYQAVNSEGAEVTVFPLKGRGLWGGLWGYVAVDAQNKVTGAYFDHESETAGLGALIKEEPFQSQFIGRPVNGPDGNVALTVVKKGSAKSETEVDGVTGATLTSKGVGEMVQSGLQAYMDVLRQGAGVQGLMGCQKHEGCQKAEKCCDKPECKCAEKKLCACKDGSCGDAACNCASDAKCCARQECACASCEKVAPCQKHEGCQKAGKCCDKPDCKCAEKKVCACKDGSCGDQACNCASGEKCCARQECPCTSCEKAAPCQEHEGCQKHEGCAEGKAECGKCPEKAAGHKCKSGNDCCKSGKCDKSGSCGKEACKGDKACCGH